MPQDTVREALLATIERLQEKPAGANVVFRASTQLLQGVSCRGSVRDFPDLIIDEPPELGGADSGINPVELLLVALGTCQEIVYAAYAAVLGIPLSSVKVDLKGYVDLRGLFGLADVPSGYSDIRFETRIESDATSEEIQKLVETVEAHCPVLDTLSRPIDISGTAFLNGTRLACLPQPATG